jgi:hypothetical protein
MSFLRLALVAAGLSLAATTASGKDLVLDPEEGPNTGTCIVSAMGVVAAVTTEVSVTAKDGKLVLDVTEVRPDCVRFRMPAKLEPGPLHLAIVVHGQLHRATFKVFDGAKEDAKARADRHEEIRGKLEGGGKYEDPFRQNPKLLAVTRLELQGGATPCAIVEGTTGLRDDLFLTVAFGRVGQDEPLQIAAHKVGIKGSAWKTTFGLAYESWSGKTLLAGKYYVYVLFEMAKQSPLVLRHIGWPEKLSDGERVARDIIWSRKIVDVGTPDEVKAQADEVRAHYAELVHATTDAFESVERACAAAGKCYFKQASGAGIDHDAWAKWVKERGVGLDADDMKKIDADERFSKGGFFAPEPWQRWATQDLFKTLREAHEKHAAFEARYVGSPDPRAEVEGENLVSIVLGLARRYSGELYGRAKLTVPEELRAPLELAGVVETPDVSRTTFETRRASVRERFALAAR